MLIDYRGLHTNSVQCQSDHQDPKNVKSKVKYVNILEISEFSFSDIVKIQAPDVVIVELMNWLKDRSMSISDNVKKSSYTKYLEKYEILEDVLIYRENGLSRIVVPESHTRELTRYIHTELCHMSSRKLSENF